MTTQVTISVQPGNHWPVDVVTLSGGRGGSWIEQSRKQIPISEHGGVFTTYIHDSQILSIEEVKKKDGPPAGTEGQS